VSELTPAASRTRSPSSAVLGVLVFAATEATLFGTLIATYFYLRLNADRWPPQGVEAPAVALPVALTAALVLTTAPVLLAAVAAARGRRGAAWLLVLGATVVQAGYLAWQIVLYFDDLSKFAPDETTYGSIYFTLLGTHHIHVAIGLLLDLWVLARVAAGLTSYRVTTVRVVAIYWVLVNAVAVLVTATQVSAA
jgi:heme/copper-type cytochrome/quinol oxidase subunit 3